MTIFEELQAKNVPITKDAYGVALSRADEGTLELIEYLIAENLVPKEIGCLIWSDRIGYAYVDPIVSLVSEEASASIPIDIARRGLVIPLYEIEGALTVAMPDPGNTALVERLAMITGKKVSPVFCLTQEVQDAIELHYSSLENVTQIVSQIEESYGSVMAQMNPAELEGIHNSDAIINLFDAILYLALKERASALHVQVSAGLMVVRLRIDGRLRTFLSLNVALHQPLISRVKVLCSMKLAEARFPQDGRFSIQLGTGSTVFRTSILPSVDGEKLVIRIMSDSDKAELGKLDQLYIAPSILEPFKRVVSSPNGLVLVAGPTGAGKSSTLYAALDSVNKPEVNICTIENPIEAHFDGITQTQVLLQMDVTYMTLLKSILRQDPDVILIGEISDLDTAKIAVQASLTSHLVLSTINANNSIQAAIRLTQLGIDPALIAPSLLAVLAQRLGARICDKCKVSYKPSPEVLAHYFHDSELVEVPSFYKGEGCATCQKTGYFGRIGFHELAVISDEMRSLITRGASDNELIRAAARFGYRSLRYDALMKVLLGLTTIEEMELRTPILFDESGA